MLATILTPLKHTMLAYIHGGLGVVGPSTPSFSCSQFFTMATTDCFLKWAKAISLRELGQNKLLASQGPILFIDMQPHKRLISTMHSTSKIK